MKPLETIVSLLNRWRGNSPVADLQTQEIAGDCDSIPWAGHRVFVVDGKIFKIRGVTYPNPPTQADFEKLSDLGVNTIRTWGIGERTEDLLDIAYRYKIKVMLGIWLRHGRPGAEGDDHFDWIRDRAGKSRQKKNALKAVLKYKNHPALLGWGIGNEVTLNIETELEKVAYAKFLEKLCRAIKRIDSTHPIASISAWTTDIPYWERYCGSLDIYGINVYGYGAYSIPSALTKLGVKKPFFLGEFGPTGEWEARTDANGVKVEPKDTEKYSIYAKTWNDIETKSGAQFSGGFMFNFGDGLTFAGIWLNFFFNGKYRPSYWGTRKAFTGKDPVNKLPTIQRFRLINAETSHPHKSWIDAELLLSGECKDPCNVSFYYNQRLGGREQRDAVYPLVSEPGELPHQFRVQLPNRPGPTKIYVFVEDNNLNLTIESASIRVFWQKDREKSLDVK